MSEKASFQVGHQLEMYRRGDAGHPAGVPFAVEELEALAKARMSAEDYDWCAGTAGGGATGRANLGAFDRWRIQPRMLADIAERELSVEVFGKRWPVPFAIAPIGVQAGCHPEGEKATARAAASLGIPFVLSTVASFDIETVAAASGDGPRWFQLYWPAHEGLTESLVRRAEAAGYEAIVVTLDTPQLGWRESNLQLAHLPFLEGIGLANYFSDPVFRSLLERPPEEDVAAAAAKYLELFSDLSRTWAALESVRSLTKLPVLVKGVQRGDDARRALEAGVDGVVVSNHGGRQTDGSVGTLEVLPEVVEAVDGRVPVLFDSGIRRGCDVFKALALGARAVLVGRPYLWALTVGGEAGVRQWLKNLSADFDLTLGLAGRRRAVEIERGDVRG